MVKKISTADLDFAVDLAGYAIDGKYYDFHNDYILESILLDNGILRFFFLEDKNNQKLELSFYGVIPIVIELVDFFNPDSTTVDIIYRGRFLLGDKLIETLNGRQYIYVDFISGHRFEFWSEAFSIIDHFD